MNIKPKKILRKLNIDIPRKTVIALAVVASHYPYPAISQADGGPNVIDFLDAVGRLCGGQTSQDISSEGENISLRSAEVTVDPGTGNLRVEQNGVLIAEQGGEPSRAYYECVEKLTEALGGAFASRPTPSARDEIGYPEPTRDEMLQAHTEQVAVGALFVGIDHFEKAGCKPSQNVGYDCSYAIRSGGFGAPKFVTNTFAKAGGRWIMYWRDR
ncbi:hypothetical protein So717_43260 [Roseobacter cerasinus]|uniref:Uncharacterized protein n=2 Tax=Roseobacter cerasinus TaxID=2602289 RepID=A0A640VWQ5_9RHOB|nr:hypothetical protein So717_43260 [Roseobacter cerasinus]